ncbi:MAG: thioredoxin family protein [Elusimicrobia bacterium]|nr:thioredoxin family protein [Elusimicrobiota bacterium]
MRRAAGWLLLFLPAVCAFSQIYQPVRWEISVREKHEIVFTAHIEPGWHIYGLTEPDFGPNPTVFNFEKISGAQMEGKVFSTSPMITAYEALFGAETTYFENNPEFIQKFKLQNAQKFEISGYIEYSVCNIKRCMNLTEEFSFTPESLSSGTAKKAAAPEAENAAVTKNDLWKPVTDELNSYGPQDGARRSWLGIFLISFAGGLLALFMPCIWPMIPITVGIFLKRSNNDFKKSAAGAALYGLSILVIYLLFGLFFTLVFGAAALNNLATNAVANLIFFALFVLFAVSFFGAFEFQLPAAWADKINNKAHSSAGIIGIFFMAFTLVLVSFSCTAPIVGTLLVQLTSADNILSPAVGMAGFGLALAIPFALFAFVPSLMKKMPKSGEWLNTLKVTLGFLELALALKFLSMADLVYHWHILNRQVFLVLWILIFASLGFYLLKKVKRAGFILAAVPFLFVLYMIPGLWGAPLKDISAFLPPLYTQKFDLYGGELKPKFYDYDEGMASAAKDNKPVMIDFTGYGCVNCRKMEAAVLSDARVRKIIDNDYVLIALYVDDRTKLPQTIEKEENGKEIKLRTVGDKWSYLQRYKFGANAQPYYILLDNLGNPLAGWRAYDENIDGFVKYLESGIKNYNRPGK